MANMNSSAIRSVVDRLSHSEERFRLLVECVQDHALFMLDPAGRVASWNQGAQRMKGYRPEEIVGRNFALFYTREDADAGKPDLALEKTAATGRYEDEGWRVRKDGSRFWAGVIVTAMRDETGKLRGYAKVTRDLTERIRAMQCLKESEARLQAFLCHSPGLMFIKNLDGRYQYVNDQFCRFFGLQRDAVLERTDAEIFCADQAVGLQNNDTSVIVAGAALEFEETADYPDGQHICIVRKFPIRNSDGRIAALGGVVTDITERKRIERELLDMREHLEASNAPSNAGHAAESKGGPHKPEAAYGSDVDGLALMISRDLRPPLRNIESLAAQVREGMAEMNAMARRLDRIAKSAAGLTKLTNDLLIYTRSGRLNPDHRRCADLNAIVASVRKDLGTAAGTRRIDWNIGKLPQVAGAPAFLKIVFEQLLSNAVQFTRQRDPAVVEVAAIAIDNDEVVIEIKDNGLGFGEQQAHRLFGAFQRLHGGNQFDGTGIGLATAKRIVECHGGRVWARSQPGAGASFYLALQLAAAAPK